MATVSTYPEFPIWPSDSRIMRFSCPGHNEFATRAGPREIAGFRQLVFARLTSPACCRAIDFSDTTPILLTRAQILQPLPARHRQRIDPPQHLAKQPPVQMSLGQQQPVVPGVLDQSPASLHEPLLQASQRPGVDSLRQHQPPPQVAQVVGLTRDQILCELINRNVGSAASRSASLRSS